jgi:restriction system protein
MFWRIETMGKRSGFSGILPSMAREAARQQRAAEAARRRQMREALRWERETKRAQALAEKEARKEYEESRVGEVHDLNIELRERITELTSILEHTLKVDDSIAFDSLRIREEYLPFEPPEDVRTPLAEPTEESFAGRVAALKGLRSLLPGAKRRYERRLLSARDQYRAARDKWQTEENQRQAKLKALREQYERGRLSLQTKKDQRDAEVSELQESYAAGDPEAVVAYNNLVLERSEYPDNFPQEFRLAYVRESKQLVIEYELPAVEVVPAVQEYRYVKTRDEIAEKPGKATEVKDLYQDIVSAVALRSIHEVLEADQGNHIDVVCFNGFVQTVDPATGKDTRPHLISVRTTRQKFDEIDLSRVDKKVCLRNLGAQVSPRAAEAQPVKPVVEFDMVDRRFVDQSDVLADLESRPNLIELSPFEFEHLVANLFAQMGLESKLTRSSRDGGVDCVAFDHRPVLGGKVVIQAKRYSNTVGVSAVRDLYGTMMNEGANKGILVTTSGYGPDAFEFCKDKPIELIDGAGLLYLLREVGTEARIVFPDD